MIAYGGTAPAVLALYAIAEVLDWSRLTFRISVFALVAVYVPLAVSWLLGRRERGPSPTRS